MSVNPPDTTVEVNTAIHNMITDTITILQRRDAEQIKRLRELWIGFGVDLAELNAETVRILKDQSWRRK